MYQALYRKYRPQSFDDVVGQQAVTQTLKQQLISGRMSHAYLFTGSRGTGKTSCAKILAKAVNCQNPQGGNPCNRCDACRAIDAGSCMDVLEIDAASNNGVDSVRDLRDGAVYTPSQVKKRVYIIDEVHMLSIPAFNALLKIVEEPPEYVLFILATTELHKVPVTILSRCQRFSFRRISQEDIAARLQDVSYQENIDLDAGAARLLARLADGGLRDGLSLLDQCASATVGEVTERQVYDCLGIAGERRCGELMACIAGKDTRGALSLFSRLYAEGKDVGAMMDELTCMARDLLVLKTAGEAGIPMLSGVATDEETLALVKRFSDGELVRMLGVLQQTTLGFKKTASRRLDAEVCLVNLCQPELRLDGAALNARLTRVEEQLRSGSFVVPPEPELPVEAPAVPVAEEPEEPSPVGDAVPVGFWTDVTEAIHQNLPIQVAGYFTTGPEGPVTYLLQGNQIVLLCQNSFVCESVGGPEALREIGRIVSGKLGRPVKAVVQDRTASPGNNRNFRDLETAARGYGFKIKEN